MQVKIIADENVSFRIIQALRSINLDVFSVFESNRGIPDFSILEICKKQPSILITSDKNFASWAAASHLSNFGLILLRFDRKDIDQIISVVKSLLLEPENLLGKYNVISPVKIRQREII